MPSISAMALTAPRDPRLRAPSIAPRPWSGKRAADGRRPCRAGRDFHASWRRAVQERPVHGVHDVVVDVTVVAPPFAVAEEGAVVRRGELLGQLQRDRLGMKRVAEIAEDNAVVLLGRERFYAVPTFESAARAAGNDHDGAVLPHLH